MTEAEIDAHLEAVLKAAESSLREAMATALPRQAWPDTCATEGCGRPAAIHFIRGNIGSHYCRECYLKVQAIPTPLNTVEPEEGK